MSLRVAVPDLISPSYFPAIAAVEMGFFEKEGFEAKLELLYPVTRTYEELREGRLDFVGGAAHAALYAFKDWKGGRLLCALAQHMYWFLVLRKDLNPRRGDLTAVKGLRIGAAPGPVDGLKRMLQRAGIDPARDAIRAVTAAQKALKEDPDRATAVGRKLFPPTEAGLIAELIRRDSPFYDPAISKQTVASMNRFAQDIGLLAGPVPYEQVVWKP